MGKIVSHSTKKSKKHRYANVGDLFYRIRWYGYKPAEDNWQPIQKIQISRITSYHNRKRLPLSANLEDYIYCQYSSSTNLPSRSNITNHFTLTQTGCHVSPSLHLVRIPNESCCSMTSCSIHSSLLYKAAC